MIQTKAQAETKGVFASEQIVRLHERPQNQAARQYENFIVLNGLEVELMALIRLSEKKVQGYHYYFKKLLSPAKRQQHVWGIGLNHLSSFLGTTIFWRKYDSQVCLPPHSING